MWSDLTLGPSFKVKRGKPNLKVLITQVLLVLEVCNVKPTYRKSCAESSDVVRFDLGPSFKVKRRQPNLKVLIPHLFLVLEVWYVKPTYRKSWAGSDLTLGSSFKVK